VQKLEAIFKRRENNQDKDDGNDNTFGEYWEFQEPSEIKFWSLELDPVTAGHTLSTSSRIHWYFSRYLTMSVSRTFFSKEEVLSSFTA
jgi:hypothetical protein